MDLDQTVHWWEHQDIKYRPEVLARQQKDSQNRQSLGDSLKRVRGAHPDGNGPYPSQLDVACQLIAGAVAQGDTYPVVFDRWYRCQPVGHQMANQGLISVGTVEPDNGVSLKGHWVSLQDGYQPLPEQAVAPVRFRYRHRQTMEHSGAAASTRPVDQWGRVRRVASHKKEDRSDEPRFYVGHYGPWELSSRLGRRQWRWPIEPSYQDTKGPLGFAA